MNVSAKGRYALKMMIDIAEHSSNEWVSIKAISKRQGISVKYLEQIVANLTRANLLRSRRGSSGGYMLAKTPDQYTVGDILRVIEGKLAPVACLKDEINHCERSCICQTLGFWSGLYKAIDDYVDSVTLDDFMKSQNVEEQAVMLNINKR